MKKHISIIGELSQNLHRTVYLMDKIAGEILESQFALTFSQFRILMVVHKKKAVSSADIAKFHDLSPAAISRQIGILKKNKLITVKSNPANRRQYQLELTADGERAIKKMWETLARAYQKIYIVLPAEQQQQLSNTLALLVEEIHSKGLQHFCS